MFSACVLAPSPLSTPLSVRLIWRGLSGDIIFYQSRFIVHYVVPKDLSSNQFLRFCVTYFKTACMYATGVTVNSWAIFWNVGDVTSHRAVGYFRKDMRYTWKTAKMKTYDINTIG